MKRRHFSPQPEPPPEGFVTNNNGHLVPVEEWEQISKQRMWLAGFDYRKDWRNDPLYFGRRGE